jgi:hypothetical protein
MLTRFAILRRADDDGVDAAVVERDYVLAPIVVSGPGVSVHPFRPNPYTRSGVFVHPEAARVAR